MFLRIVFTFRTKFINKKEKDKAEKSLAYNAYNLSD